MSIGKYLDKIRNAVYGREVRESIAKGIETAYDDASEKDNANMEVKIARGTHPNLRSRLEEVDNKQQQTTAQLAQKVGLGKKAELEDLSPRVLSAIEGGEGTSFDLLSEPQNNSVTDEKVVDGSLSVNKMKDSTFEKNVKTINLFDKEDENIELGGYYNGGVWTEAAGTSTSGFIKIEPYTPYTFFTGNPPRQIGSRINLYNEDLEYAGGGTSFSDKLSGSKYPFIRFTFTTSHLENVMMIKDVDIPKPIKYVPFEIAQYKLGKSWLIGKENIENNSVDVNKIEGARTESRKTINLFDKEDENIELGGYYNEGKWVSSASNTTSGFIKIEPYTPYTFFTGNPPRQIGSRINFYNEDLEYVSGGGHVSDKISSSIYPYVRLTINNDNLETFMMIKDSEIPENIEYTPHEVEKYRLEGKWDVLSSKDLNNVKGEDINFLYSPDYTKAVKLDLKDFSGYDQPWHPSVEYIKGGFAGSEYWMAQSPYPNGGKPSRVRWEVPVIYKSDDGVKWETVADPLDDLTDEEIARDDYMSDPELVFRKDLNRLEVWYRLTKNVKDLPTTLFRKYTTDGKNWSEREVMISERTSTDPLLMRSHSIMYDIETSEYRAWFSNDSFNYFSRPLMYSTSSDGKEWTEPVYCNVDINRTVWHSSVTLIDGEFHYINFYRPIDYSGFRGIGQTLFYYKSTDGINFKFQRTIMSTTDNNGTTFYKNGLYRTDVVKGHDNKFKLYFSYVDDNGKNSVGLMSGDAIDFINPVPKIDARNAITREGETLNDIAIKLDRLKRDFDNYKND